MPHLPAAVEGPEHGPIGIRTEYITTDETTIRMKELDTSVLTRDYVLTRNDGQSIMHASGKTISRNLRREFTDADGLPLFELRQTSSQKQEKSWSLSMPGADAGDDVLTVIPRMFFVHTKFGINFRNLAPPSSNHHDYYRDNVALEVRGRDMSNLIACVTCDGRTVMQIRREADASGQRAAYKHAYGYRTEWEVTVAQGVDLSLAAIAVIILAEQRG